MNNDLAHHGIKGMHWGVRRFQNEDGTLTAAGKQRAREAAGNQAKSMDDADLRAKVTRMNLEKQYGKLSAEQVPPSQTEKAKKLVDQTNELVRQTKKLVPDTKPRLDLSNMSDKELRDKINRELLERQYSDLFSQPTTVSQGQTRMNQILDVAGNVLTIGSTALGIAMAIQNLRKG